MTTEEWVNRINKSRLLYNKLYNIYFYYIPKSGCTSIRHFLNVNTLCDELDYNECNINKNNIYCLLRCPIKRLVSGYMTRSFFIDNDFIKEKNYKNFKIFLEKLILIDIYKVDVHFTPQYILMNEQLTDKIYNFDNINNLEKDIQTIYSNKFIFPHEHFMANDISNKIYNKILNDNITLNKIKNYYMIDYIKLNNYF